MEKHLYRIIISASIFFFFGCKSKPEKDFEIVLNSININLKASPSADAPMPPVINFVFKLKNLTDSTKIFITKSNVSDYRKSKLLMLDTLNNRIIPIYSNSIPVVKGGDSTVILGSISVREIAEYLKLDSLFFDKIDFSNQGEFLSRITTVMIDNSIIVYVPNSSDLKRYSSLDIKSSLFYSVLIKVEKPLSIRSVLSPL